MIAFSAFLLVWGLALPAFAAPDPWDAASSADLRLRLGDPRQERRTTSLNWIDLPTGSGGAETESADPVRVVIDAGHGGRDLGAVGPDRTSEKNICLRIARLVRRELLRSSVQHAVPIEVYLTRDDDRFVPLRDRVRLANDLSADLFVSIHANSADTPMARGFEVYFQSAEASDRHARRLAVLENDAGAVEPIRNHDVLSMLSEVQASEHVAHSSRFAESVFDALSRRLRPNGLGVRQAPFTVLAGTAMPSLLVEVGYLTHPDEAVRLTKGSYLKRLAGAISTGIVEFAERAHPRVAPPGNNSIDRANDRARNDAIEPIGAAFRRAQARRPARG